MKNTPFIVTFNVVECPKDKIVPVTPYIIVAINSHFLDLFFFFLHF